MKAIGATRFLPVTETGCLVEFETERPVPGPRDLLVRVEAIAVNPVDAKVRKSLGEGSGEARILGWDAAGVVEAVGSEVQNFRPGDEVFYAGDLTRPGCNAEFHAVDARIVARKPASWSFADAAAVPLVALTAWELLGERMDAQRAAGGNLLVINGAGGVGSAMIPLARHFGLTVVATASRPETTAWCEARGAQHVIDHHQPLRPQVEALGISSFPFIANLHNTEMYWDATCELVAPLGSLGFIVEPGEKLAIGDPLKAKCVRIAWEFMFARSKFQTADMHRQGEILAEVARLCDEGTFPKLATRTFDKISAENLREAHAGMESGTAHGKWVLAGW